MAEPRNQYEGSLRWVVASGSGLTWATSSAPASGLLGYVRNFTVNSGRTVATIMDRGVPKVQKLVSNQAIAVQFDVAYGITAEYPPISGTGIGSTMKLFNFELRMSANEIGATSAQYFQVLGVPITQQNFSEGAEENTMSFQGVGLASVGPTASGYLG